MELNYNLNSYTNEDFKTLFNYSQVLINNLEFLSKNEDLLKNTNLLKDYIKFYKDELRMSAIIK